MQEYVYTKVNGKLSEFFEKIRNVGIPDKANNP